MIINSYFFSIVPITCLINNNGKSRRKQAFGFYINFTYKVDFRYIMQLVLQCFLKDISLFQIHRNKWSENLDNYAQLRNYQAVQIQLENILICL